MKTLFLIGVWSISSVSLVWSQALPSEFVLVEGGTFKHPGSNYYGKGIVLSDLYLGRDEVTQAQWEAVMGSNPSAFRGATLPVESVSWYDCIEYCNRRSRLEGLTPYYRIEREVKDPLNLNEFDEMRWTVTVEPGGNGYRLPTEAEWEYAAGGGQKTRGFVYSGSHSLEAVGWYWQNSGDEPLHGGWNWPLIEANNAQPKPVGTLAPNELGLHDMSGNVREWCWDWIGELGEEGRRDPQGPASGSYRVWKGGGWFSGDFCAEPAFRGPFDPSSAGPDQGFRLARSRTPAAE